MQPSSTTSPWWTCISILTITVFFSGCDLRSPDFATLPSGSQWLLISFGEQEQSLDSAALVTLNVAVYDDNKEIMLKFSEETVPIPADELWSVLFKHYVGDSLFYLSVGRDFLRPDGYSPDTLYYAIGIKRMRTKAQVADARFREFSILDSLVRLDSMAHRFTEFQDVWMRTLTVWDTTRVRDGREVVIHYQGRTLSGNVFDDSRERNMPLRFVYGHEHQVLRGIELALGRMHRGEKAEVIIPSWLAYGSRGSAYNLVPPFTPVIYEIEVVELARE